MVKSVAEFGAQAATSKRVSKTIQGTGDKENGTSTGTAKIKLNGANGDNGGGTTVSKVTAGVTKKLLSGNGGGNDTPADTEKPVKPVSPSVVEKHLTAVANANIAGLKIKSTKGNHNPIVTNTVEAAAPVAAPEAVPAAAATSQAGKTLERVKTEITTWASKPENKNKNIDSANIRQVLANINDVYLNQILERDSSRERFVKTIMGMSPNDGAIETKSITAADLKALTDKGIPGLMDKMANSASAAGFPVVGNSAAWNWFTMENANPTKLQLFDIASIGRKTDIYTETIRSRHGGRVGYVYPDKAVYPDGQKEGHALRGLANLRNPDPQEKSAIESFINAAGSLPGQTVAGVRAQVNKLLNMDANARNQEFFRQAKAFFDTIRGPVQDLGGEPVERVMTAIDAVLTLADFPMPGT
jgi:hypothetical protein